MPIEVKKIVLQNIRFGFEHLWEASAAVASAKKKFSVEIRIPKTDTANIALVQAAIDELTATTKKKNKSDKFPEGKLPKDFEVYFIDGDEHDKSGYEGCYFLSAKSDRQVGVFGTQKDANGDLKPLDREDFKAGDWGNASIGAYVFEEGKGGISFFLNGIQKKRDGEPLSSGSRNDSADFRDLPEDDDDENSLM